MFRRPDHLKNLINPTQLFVLNYQFIWVGLDHLKNLINSTQLFVLNYQFIWVGFDTKRNLWAELIKFFAYNIFIYTLIDYNFFLLITIFLLFILLTIGKNSNFKS